jgi:hypothetical protein
MLVAATCLVVLALRAWIWSAGRNRPLEQSEVNRLRRLSERL